MKRSFLPLVLTLAMATGMAGVACDSNSSGPAASAPAAPAAEPGSVGASIDFEGPDLAFVRVFVDSPAAKAGIKPHDHVLRINGVDTAAMTINQAKDAFHGPVGSSLTLTVKTGGQDPRAVTVVRGVVTNKTPMADTAAPPAAPAAAPAVPPAAPPTAPAAKP